MRSGLLAAILCMILFCGARAQECATPPAGVVAWWTLDEIGGNSIADIEGRFPGMLINGPTQMPGLIANALQFDGIDDYVGVADSSVWAFGGNDFTIELWANFSSPGGGSVGEPGDVFIGNDEGQWNVNKWFFALGGGYLNFHINGPAIGAEFFPLVPFDPVVGEWYHLAVTRSGNTYSIYVNGISGGTAENDHEIPDANAPLTIGQAENLGYMNGMLDEITIYDRALTAEELLAIYNAGSSGKCRQLDISTESLSIVKMGTFFSTQIEAQYGQAPLSWIITGGVLPPGVEMNTGGVLGGTAVTTGEFAFTVRVEDASGAYDEEELILTVLETLPDPEVRLFKSGTVVVPGREVDYFILVENRGGVAAADVGIAEILDPAQVSLVSVNPPGVAPDSVLSDASFIYWVIPELSVGETVLLSYKVRILPTVSIGTIVNGGPACARADGLDMGGRFWECIKSAGAPLPNCLICIPECTACGVFCSIPTIPTIVGCIGCLLPCIDCMAIGAQTGMDGGCIGSMLPVIECWKSFYKDCVTNEQPARGAIDPNDKVVLADEFIQPDQSLVYVIHFENIGDIEARDVFITDTLNANLDISTLEVLTPAGSSFDPATRTLRWDLLDRNLQPGETDQVTYSIKPMPGLPSGTEIRNNAYIQFEVFDIYPTNEVVNTIDMEPPMAVMRPLPAEQQAENFDIAWHGADAVGRIGSYSVYVSVDGGAYMPYIEGTADTSVVFHGEGGKAYGFICVALDIAGNAEIQGTAAEAFTCVKAPTAVLLKQFGARAVENGIELSWEVTSDGEVHGYEIRRRRLGESGWLMIDTGGLLAPAFSAFIDRSALAGTTYEYTLVVWLKNGSEMVSGIETARLNPNPTTLDQNFPNPFNPATTISFTVPERTHVKLSIYTVEGRLVRTLVDGKMEGGAYNYPWDGKGIDGKDLESGVYFYRLTVGKNALSRKMVLLK